MGFLLQLRGPPVSKLDSASIHLQMQMSCAETDVGFLDPSVRALPSAQSCDTYGVNSSSRLVGHWRRMLGRQSKAHVLTDSTWRLQVDSS